MVPSGPKVDAIEAALAHDDVEMDEFDGWGYLCVLIDMSAICPY